MTIWRSTVTIVFLLSGYTYAQKDEVQLDTTTIKGNTELPKILYVVPWSESSTLDSSQQAQRLILHSIYADFFDPVIPDTVAKSTKLDASIDSK